MIEIPPKFAGRPPVSPEARGNTDLIAREWKGAQGLAEDVRYYGRWMRDEAEKRIGYLYPKVEVTPEIVLERPDLKAYEGRSLTVIAWLWARTVKSPNPAFADVGVPLASTFMLSTKKGKEAYVEPVIEGSRVSVHGEGGGAGMDADAVKAGTKLSRGSEFPLSDVGNAHCGGLHQVRGEGRAHVRSADGGRCGGRERGRVYLAPTSVHEQNRSQMAMPRVAAGRGPLPARLTAWHFLTVPYGLSTWGDLFTSPPARRADDPFSDLVKEARERAQRDAASGWSFRQRQTSPRWRHRRVGVCRRCRGVFGFRAEQGTDPETAHRRRGTRTVSRRWPHSRDKQSP